jgi:hypothetical protein
MLRVCLSQAQHMIEAFASDAPEKSFTHRSTPRSEQIQSRSSRLVPRAILNDRAAEAESSRYGPPLAKKERKATHLSVRFTTDEHRAIERAAKVAKVAVSEWARAVILAASSSLSGGADTQRIQQS